MTFSMILMPQTSYSDGFSALFLKKILCSCFYLALIFLSMENSSGTLFMAHVIRPIYRRDLPVMAFSKASLCLFSCRSADPKRVLKEMCLDKSDDGYLFQTVEIFGW